jgi:hypothetical protein
MMSNPRPPSPMCCSSWAKGDKVYTVRWLIRRTIPAVRQQRAQSSRELHLWPSSSVFADTATL